MKAVPFRCKRAPGIEALEKYRDIQLVDPAYVAGKEHLKSAISQAKKAFSRKENISTSHLIEVVVRTSLTGQIKNAFEIVGPKGPEVIVISEEYPDQFIAEYGCVEDKSILDIDEEKYERIKEAFGIGEKEIMAVSGEGFEDRVRTLQKIITERIALINKV